MVVELVGPKVALTVVSMVERLGLTLAAMMDVD